MENSAQEFAHLTYGVERMSGEFTKYHIHSHLVPWPMKPALHHFTAPDKGKPHSHPWAFTTFVFPGYSYVERVFTHLFEDVYYAETFTREGGTSRRVEAGCIHEILELPQGECWTMVMAEEETAKWHHHTFEQIEGSFHGRPVYRLVA